MLTEVCLYCRMASTGGQKKLSLCFGLTLTREVVVHVGYTCMLSDGMFSVSIRLGLFICFLRTLNILEIPY